MPLITFHTRRVREALVRPAALGTEIFVLGLAAAVIGGVTMLSSHAAQPYQPGIEIRLDWWALPGYTLLSLFRGFAAYGISLAFTLIYGTIAAHNHRAEKFMLPMLDVLQAIPVLGFLPGLVLAMIAIFPTREIGLEIACIIMIFTGQAWNMTFSFHGSLRAIPQPLREAAAVQRLSGWQSFKLLELPASMIGLVWNSMMSFAGGWFFLTVNEAFTLGNRDYRLPGIGSYMNEAINKGNLPAMLAAIVAMVTMIVATDQLFWRPIVVWSQRFKLEDSADADKPQSWALSLMQKSVMVDWVLARLRRLRRRRAVAGETVEVPVLRGVRQWVPAVSPSAGSAMRTAVRWGAMAGGIAVALWGGWALVRLLVRLPVVSGPDGSDWLHVLMALGASFGRTSAAVLFSAAWALPLGILIGRSSKWSQRLQPIIQVTASFPAPMVFPLVTVAMAWLHLPFTVGCVALMMLGSMWYILFNVIAGATAIPADLKEASSVYRLSRRQRWWNLYIPSVFPYLVTGLVTATGGAWNATIVSEFVQVKGQTYAAFGLGSTISIATTNANFPLLCASVVTMAAFVVGVNRFFWKRLYHLAETRYSLNA